MLILSIVGVVLVVFGLLILLKLPDRPGGDIQFAGLKVSSKGAGLPLVVLGVACLAFAARGGAGGDDGNDKGAGTPTPTASPTASPVMTPTPAATPSPTPTGAETPATGQPTMRLAPAACGPDPQGENFSAVSTTVQLNDPEQMIRTGGRVPKDLRLRLFDGDDFIGVVDLKLRPTGDGTSALFLVDKAQDRNCGPASFTNK